MCPRAPPHTRGSTHQLKLKEQPEQGSPAHAGIDPRPRVASPSVRRLPRTRGDRPAEPIYGDTSIEAPPHTRGSTPAWKDRESPAYGSPAHAGIDPQ